MKETNSFSWEQRWREKLHPLKILLMERRDQLFYATGAHARIVLDLTSNLGFYPATRYRNTPRGLVVMVHPACVSGTRCALEDHGYTVGVFRSTRRISSLPLLPGGPDGVYAVGNLFRQVA